MTTQKESCPTQDELFALVSGALEECAVARIQAHLRDCTACQRFLDATRELDEIACALGSSKLNRRDHDRIARCQERLLQELRRDPQSPPPTPRPGRRPAP